MTALGGFLWPGLPVCPPVLPWPLLPARAQRARPTKLGTYYTIYSIIFIIFMILPVGGRS